MSSNSQPDDPSDNQYLRLLKTRRSNGRSLLAVHWELTYRCNEHCTHCFLDVRAPDAHAAAELTTQECRQVIDQLAELGTMNLTFSGGEPLLRSDFFEVAGYARHRRFVVRLCTNGALIDDAGADRIHALHPFAVEISLYGADAATHEAITRRPHSFARTLRAFRLLKERKVRTIMKTPLLRDNVHQLHQLESLAAECGAHFQPSHLITARNSGDRSPLRRRLSDDELRWVLRETLTPAQTIATMQTPRRSVCGIAQWGFVLGPDGSVYPCVEVRQVAGNVRCQPVQEIWNQDEFWLPLAEVCRRMPPMCRDCAFHTTCQRCPGLALLEEGSLIAPGAENCRAARIYSQVMAEKRAMS
ncbi:MAG: radical SAM protein [Anaerolineales bacterium]|nr:radical SAM protein [Anaerolineales bacterium]